MSLEDFLMRPRRFQLWAALLLAPLTIIGLVAFGALVEKGTRSPGGLPGAAHFIARLPATAIGLVRDAITDADPNLAAEQRFAGETGFARLAPSADAGAMLALSRYDGDTRRGVVEYLDLDDGAVIARIEPDILAINARSKLQSPILNLARDKGPTRYMLVHPLPMEDGGIVFNGMYSPLVRVDACGRIVWTLDHMFHHALQRDADGNIWGSSFRNPVAVAGMPQTFHDDAIAKVSPDGKLLFEKSLADILIESGFRHYVYSNPNYTPDPLHLNDVEPALADGPFWKKGDVFLSLRNRSAIILYRPSTNKIVWMKDGPWLFQHDVNMLDDHRISVFSNNMSYLAWGESSIDKNQELIFDFATGEVTEPFREGFVRHDIRTMSAGRGTILPIGEIFVEEQNYGRILQMKESGDLSWRYVNRAADGRVYKVRWARYIAPDAAAGLRDALARRDCKAQ